MRRLKAFGSGVAAAALALAGLGTAAALGAGQADGATVSANALSSSWYAAAPYLMPLDNTPPDNPAGCSAARIDYTRLHPLAGLPKAV